MIALEVLGWAGALALLLAYTLLTAGRATAAGGAYLALNLAGSAGLSINGAVHTAWPSAALNLLWLAVGLQALRARRHHLASATPRPS